jgi:hypothetical protein
MNIEQGFLNHCPGQVLNKEVSVPSIFDILNSLFDILFSFKTFQNYGGIALIHGNNRAFQGPDI